MVTARRMLAVPIVFSMAFVSMGSQIQSSPLLGPNLENELKLLCSDGWESGKFAGDDFLTLLGAGAALAVDLGSRFQLNIQDGQTALLLPDKAMEENIEDLQASYHLYRDRLCGSLSPNFLRDVQKAFQQGIENLKNKQAFWEAKAPSPDPYLCHLRDDTKVCYYQVGL